MDLGIIVALGAATITITGVMMAMMFWCRQEANTIRAEAKEDRKDLLQVSRNLENSVVAIETEVKDFHARLLRIEERRGEV